jgi:hypothetical protein
MILFGSMVLFPIRSLGNLLVTDDKVLMMMTTMFIMIEALERQPTSYVLRMQEGLAIQRHL